MISDHEAESPNAEEPEAQAGVGANRPESPRDGEIADAIEAEATERALTLLAKRYGEGLGELCMALTGDQTDAEELMVDTFADAFRELEAKHRPKHPKAWLFGLARKHCARHLELQGTREEDEELSGVRGPAATRQLLEALYPSQREILVLRYQGSLSYQELSVIYEISPAQARERVSLALRHAHQLSQARAEEKS